MSRTFSILEAFSEHDGTLSLAQLTKRTGLPKTTVHRIASNLTRMGLLQRSDGDFRLGLHLFELGALVPEQRQLRQVALPYMQDLYAAHKQVVHLGVLDNRDVLYVLKIAGHKQVPVPTRDGGRMPATCTSLGKAMLAFSSRASVQSVIDGGLARLTPYSISVPKVLLDDLAEVARTGVAYDREESVLGVVCVAAPIAGIGPGALAALSLTGRPSQLDLSHTASAVRSAASAISRQLAADQSRG